MRTRIDFPALMSRPILRRSWKISKDVGRKFFVDSGLFLAAGLAFYLLLYTIPLGLLIISALGYTLVDSDRALAGVQGALQTLLPTSQQMVTETLSLIVAKRGFLGLVGFVALLISSLALFGSIRIVLNTVFEVRRSRRFMMSVGMDFLMMLATVALVMTTIGMTSLLTVIGNFSKGLPFLAPLLSPGWILATRAISFLFTLALFYLLYRFSPAQTIGPQGLALGSLAGAGLLEVSKGLFTWYIGFVQAIAGFYGVVGGMIVFFLWIYYAANVFILGAILGWISERAVPA